MFFKLLKLAGLDINAKIAPGLLVEVKISGGDGLTDRKASSTQSVPRAFTSKS